MKKTTTSKDFVKNFNCLKIGVPYLSIENLSHVDTHNWKSVNMQAYRLMTVLDHSSD